jgi:hypothetical protein
MAFHCMISAVRAIGATSVMPANAGIHVFEGVDGTKLELARVSQT